MTAAAPPPEGNTHWASLAEAGSAAGIRFLLLTYRLGGPLLFRCFLLPVIAYFFMFRGQARQASLDYLRRIRALSPQQAQQRLWWQSFLHFWQFGLSLLDKLAVWHGKIRLQDTTLHNHKAIEQLTAQGLGGVLLISHLGNFEICRCLSTAKTEIRLTVLMHTHHAEKFNRILEEQTGQHSIEILQVTEITPATAMLLSERVGRGEFIAIAGDRIAVNTPENHFLVDFLGNKAPLPRGPFTLAAILRAPIITLFCVHESGRYHIYFDQLSAPLHVPRRQRADILDGLAQRYANQLQAHCLRTPLQWFNFYDFWHVPPSSPPSSPQPGTTAADEGNQLKANNH